jgi:argininosuccinate synthase
MSKPSWKPAASACASKQKAYTINENLLGLTMSGGEIDSVGKRRARVRAAGAHPAREWPAEAAGGDHRLRARRSQWRSMASAWRAMSSWRAQHLFAAYGVGRGMYTGDTTIGLKGRIVFEAPGLTALLAAHRALEEAVLTKQQNRFKPEVARKWVELVYEGFYHDPLKTDLEAFLARPASAMVNGEVVLETQGEAWMRWRCVRRTSSMRRVRPTRSRPTGAWRRPKASSSCTA